jgi:drug/metabolite transporter (DMT)-like permease
MGIMLSLSAALCWGVADFFAAFVTRRIGAIRAQLLIQSISLLAVAAFLTARGTLLSVSLDVWVMALGLGVAQCVGVLLLYRAFEIGTLSIVAPISSSFVVFTALFAWLGGERPTTLVLSGALMLFAGVVLVTQAPAKTADQTTASRAGIGEALAAAVFISLVFWQFDKLSQQSSLLWPLLPLRICTVTGAALILLLAKPPLPVPAQNNQRPLWPFIFIVTIVESLAWLSFIAALRFTSTTVATALSSLFAAVTIFMAWLFLKERLARIQWAGVAVILLGVLMVSL